MPRGADSPWEQIAPIMFDDARWAAAVGEVDAAVALMEIQPPASILDVACGPGRHVLELARRRYDATGLDVTAAFLEVARHRAATEGLHIQLLAADMRRFDLPKQFDGVLSMSTSFGYFENPDDDILVLENVYRALKPGGVFLMELLSKEVAARTLQPRSWMEDGGTILLTEQRISNEWNWMHHRLVFIQEDVRQSFDLGHRLYAASELRFLLQRTGFERVNLYGSLEGEPYDEGASTLVLVAHS
jgi:ubiquinone/menaquinone biosynthesis C-methylase UbiE